MNELEDLVETALVDEMMTSSEDDEGNYVWYTDGTPAGLAGAVLAALEPHLAAAEARGRQQGDERFQRLAEAVRRYVKHWGASTEASPRRALHEVELLAAADTQEGSANGA